MLKKLLIVFLTAMFPLTHIMAQEEEEEEEQGSGPNPYTECGIGAAIFQNTGWAAATSNATWDLGTTAIISAASSPEMCNEKNVETARLILETLPSLEKDIAQADGKHLGALYEKMSCGPESHTSLSSGIRSEYAGFVTDASYESKSRRERAFGLYQSVRNVVRLSPSSCDITL